MSNKRSKTYPIKSKGKYFLFLCLYIFLYPLAFILYGRKNKWLICERGDDAQDNGFIFFKYVMDNHPEIKPVYLIKKNSKDYQKVSSIGKTVEFGSFKHFLMCIGSPVKISSNLFGYTPWIQMTTFYRRNKARGVHVFLQHGVTKNTHVNFYKENCMSLTHFICGAKPEYEFINADFHYNNETPKYTGFARFDYLLPFETNKEILIMPTWRANLVNLPNEDFAKTDFFIKWNSLLQNDKLIELCKSKGIKIKFYLHYQFQKYSSLFKGNEVVQVMKYGEETVQALLKETILLITDFSSVFFDYTYMDKPIIFYQFDEEDYYSHHYEKGYFDYRRDGFGPVHLEENEVVSDVLDLASKDFKNSEEYQKRSDRFFKFKDKDNSLRIFNSIMEAIK